jgi:antitoxin component YwqK of YwqJK toxin-antitoxin module
LKKTSYILAFFLLTQVNSFAQTHHAKHEHVVEYTQAQVMDSSEGVRIYDKLMKMLAMDYELLRKEGSTVKGWNEEYFENGQLMHISYYKEGKLVLFKNFFESGQCQHNITFTDSMTCNIDVYFENGGLKNQICFYKRIPKKLTEYFANGLPKSNIEFDTELNCLSSKRSWFLNAEIHAELQLLDPKEKKYSEKMFYPNGQLKEDGELVYLAESKEYIRSGLWHSYESSGKRKHSEKYKVKLSSN